MSELEAKAKAGEQISLFDVAEAAKARPKAQQPWSARRRNENRPSGRSSKPPRRNSRRNRRSGKSTGNWRCDTMNRFENVDVLAALEQPFMRQNTAFYRSDFEIDKEIIRKAAASDKAEDRRFVDVPPVRDALFPGK